MKTSILMMMIILSASVLALGEYWSLDPSDYSFYEDCEDTPNQGWDNVTEININTQFAKEGSGSCEFGSTSLLRNDTGLINSEVGMCFGCWVRMNESFYSYDGALLYFGIGGGPWADQETQTWHSYPFPSIDTSVPVVINTWHFLYFCQYIENNWNISINLTILRDEYDNDLNYLRLEGDYILADGCRTWEGDSILDMPLQDKPPSIVTVNCTSCINDQTPTEAPFETNDTTPTFKIKTDTSAMCAISNVDLNYSDMISANSQRNCTDTGNLYHNCTLLPADALTLTQTDNLFISCRNYLGNETLSSTSGPLQISLENLEVQGELAIQAGIDSSVISGATVYSNQQVVIRNINNDQILATWDKLAVSNNKRWALNHLDSETQGLFNLTPAVYAAQYVGMTFQQINDSVRALINSTQQ